MTIIGRVAGALAALVCAGTVALAPASAHAQQHPADHFDPKGKAPSKFTIELLQQQKATLPLGDERDFAEQKKGFIAPMQGDILSDAGHVAWDMKRFEFLNSGRISRASTRRSCGSPD